MAKSKKSFVAARRKVFRGPSGGRWRIERILMPIAITLLSLSVPLYGIIVSRADRDIARDAEEAARVAADSSRRADRAVAMLEVLYDDMIDANSMGERLAAMNLAYEIDSSMGRKFARAIAISDTSSSELIDEAARLDPRIRIWLWARRIEDLDIRIHYVEDDASARRRASDLASLLRENGVSRARIIPANRLNYGAGFWPQEDEIRYDENTELSTAQAIINLVSALSNVRLKKIPLRRSTTDGEIYIFMYTPRSPRSGGQ